MNYDVIIIGAGPGGIFSAYELSKLNPELKVAVFESGHALNKRKCPIDGDKIKSCISCKTCSIMSGFGGAGAFSDGKYNITNDFGGTLYEYLGKKQALDLMKYVDDINMAYGGEGTKLYSTAGTRFKTLCIQNDLHLLDASVRHLGTDINYVVLENLYAELKEKVTFFFDTPVQSVRVLEGGYEVLCGDTAYTFAKDIGMLSQITGNGAALLTAPMQIAFTRAPIDNDMKVKAKWRDAGLYEAVPTLDSFAVTAQSAKRVTLKAKLHFTAKDRTLLKATLTYTVDANGGLSLAMQATFGETEAPFYPRIGICLAAKRDLEHVRYFGLGPMEAYADKRLAARLGDFTTTVQDNFEPYLRPQENGAHADTAWLHLWDAAGHGLLVTAEDAPFTFGVSHYSTEQLRNTPYRHLLTPEDVTYIHLDAAHSGCGSNSCGPALAESYQVKAGKHTLQLHITPAKNGDIEF